MTLALIVPIWWHLLYMGPAMPLMPDPPWVCIPVSCVA